MAHIDKKNNQEPKNISKKIKKEIPMGKIERLMK